MKVALDPNVLVSAFTTRGLSADVFRLVIAEHEMVRSEVVMAEFERVMTDRFGIPPRLMTGFLADLRLHGVVPGVKPAPGALDFVRDPDDRLVAAAAIAGRAEVLVTGDRDLLDVATQIPDLKVLSPRQFWEHLRTRGSSAR